MLKETENCSITGCGANRNAHIHSEFHPVHFHLLTKNWEDCEEQQVFELHSETSKSKSLHNAKGLWFLHAHYFSVFLVKRRSCKTCDGDHRKDFCWVDLPKFADNCSNFLPE